MKNILISNEIQTSVFFCNSKEVKVHAVQTGLISVKENFLNQKGQGFMSKLNIVFGNTYADFMPIWVWVIEHPEGIIVIDTGDIKETSYKHQQLLDNKFAGANIDFVQTQKTYNTILRYAEKYPVIYLPSHDENSANRLVNREYLIK